MIKRWVPEEEQDTLWEETRRIRSANMSSPQDDGRGRLFPKFKPPKRDQSDDREQNVRGSITNVFQERPPADFLPAPAPQSLSNEPAQNQATSLPADWIAHYDEATGHLYYSHLPTQAVQWEFPGPGSMPNQSSLPAVYDYQSGYAGYDSQEYGATALQQGPPAAVHDRPLDKDLEEAIERSKIDYQRPSKVQESTKSRGSKSKTSKASGKGLSYDSEIGSEANTARKVKDTNTSALSTFLAGGKRRG